MQRPLEDYEAAPVKFHYRPSKFQLEELSGFHLLQNDPFSNNTNSTTILYTFLFSKKKKHSEKVEKVESFQESQN